MAAEKELKPKSFRIDDDTAEKFKEISSIVGGNQQETLSKLIEAFEFQQGKAILTEKKEDIESFEKYVTILTRMYMSSLEDNQNITETVRTQFDALLKSKDATIQDLQEKLTVAKQLKEDATQKAKTLTDENSEFTNRITSLLKTIEDTKDNYEGVIIDKNSLNKALTDSCNELKAKNESMTADYNEFREKSKLLDKTLLERDNLIKDKSDLEDALQSQMQRGASELEQAKQHYEDLIESIKQKAELSQQKALLDLERKYQDQLQQLKEEKQKEVDKYQAKYDTYQSKYFELLERINSEKDIHSPEEDVSGSSH